MRGSVSEEIRCLARGVGRSTAVLGRSILRIMIAWSTLAARAGRWETSYSLRRGPTSGGAPARISSPRRERSSAHAARQRAQRRVADRVGVAEVDDQPAHAAGQRGVDAPLELGRVGVRDGALEVHLMHDVVKPLLANREVTRTDHGAQ